MATFTYSADGGCGTTDDWIDHRKYMHMLHLINDGGLNVWSILITNKHGPNSSLIFDGHHPGINTNEARQESGRKCHEWAGHNVTAGSTKSSKLQSKSVHKNDNTLPSIGNNRR